VLTLLAQLNLLHTCGSIMAEQLDPKRPRDPRRPRHLHHVGDLGAGRAGGTERQLWGEVLQLLAEGRLMKEVATLMKITPRTVAFHKYRIMDELHLKTNADLVRFAIKQGLVPQT